MPRHRTGYDGHDIHVLSWVGNEKNLNKQKKQSKKVCPWQRMFDRPMYVPGIGFHMVGHVMSTTINTTRINMLFRFTIS